MGFGNMMLAAASAITWSPGTGPTEDQLVYLTVDLLRKKAELSDLNVKKTPTGILGQRALETEITGHR
jgi:hypothetical protein